MDIALTDQQIESIARNATGLYERSFLFEEVPGESLEEFSRSGTVNERREKWIHTAANGDGADFQTRLEWDDLSVKVLRDLPNGYFRNGTPALPQWAHELDDFMREVSREIQNQASLFPSKKEQELFPDIGTVAFEDVFRPIVRAADERLTESRQKSLHLLASPARKTLRRKLLLFLSLHSARTLYREFDRFRSTPSNFSRSRSSSFSNSRDGIYRRFVQHVLTGAFPDVLERYPVFARNLILSVVTWVDWAGEFVERLDQDRKQIIRTFAEGEDPGRVRKIRADQSDQHCGGRCIIICTFESGLKLVYKPRSLENDQTFFRFLDKLESWDTGYEFRKPTILNRKDYGWREYVPAKPLENETEANSFYEHVGVLIFLMYVFQGDDVHCENLIACGSDPVLLDLESILSPPKNWVSEQKDLSGRANARARLQNSVKGTGFLPAAIRHPEGGFFDATGLGGRNGTITDHLRPDWKYINSDHMQLDPSYHEIEGLENLPVDKGGTVYEPEDYGDRIIEGFETSYRLFMERDANLKPDESWTSILSDFKHIRGRYLPRGTTRYSHLLWGGSAPECLRNGISRSILFDALSREILWSNHLLDEPALLQAEHTALNRLDIPLFYVDASGTELYVPGVRGLYNGFRPPPDPIPSYFDRSGFERMIERIESLSENDLERQKQVIRGTIRSRNFSHDRTSKKGSIQNTGKPRFSTETEPKEPSEFLDAAARIGHRITEQAVLEEDLDEKSASWIAMEPDLATDSCEYKPIFFSMYSGTAGIAYFLGELSERTKNRVFRRFAEYAINEILEMSSDRIQRLVQYRPVDGLSGFVSSIYPLLELGNRFNQSNWIKKARSLWNLIATHSDVGNTDSASLLTGFPGTLLILNKLFRYGNSEAVRRKRSNVINRTVQFLSSEIEQYDVENGELPEADDVNLTHGFGGALYALIETFSVSTGTEREQLKRPIRKGIRLIRKYLNRRYENQDSNRNDETEQIGSAGLSWCQGLSGTFAVLRKFEDHFDSGESTTLQNHVRREFTSAELIQNDSICCGNAGRALVLNELADQHKSEAYERSGQGIAGNLLDRFSGGGALRLPPDPDGEVPPPGLYNGMSGIGMFFLSMNGNDARIPGL